MTSTTHPAFDPISDPASWWRHLGHVAGTRVVLSGDLPAGRHEAEAQLATWIEEGITHVLDVRSEYSDEAFVAEIAPELGYIHLGVDDHGDHMDPEWFAQGVGAALQVLEDPDARILVHCHMGVNRGPSMGFAILLALGFGVRAALDAISAARPIAAVLYAWDALVWWHDREGTSPSLAFLDHQALDEWEHAHRPDVSWIINRIRVAERIQ